MTISAEGSGPPEDTRPTLSLVFPAYNEEQAIDAVLSQTLRAKEHLLRELPLGSVEVIVVDDGSRDETYMNASAYGHVAAVLRHEENRGYGAALKTGILHSRGELLGFMDVDGTCDPLSFVPLCGALLEQDADMVLGKRLHDRSHMPPLRRLGNRLFSVLVHCLVRTEVSDLATGMRVFRRRALPQLEVLPDGLDFAFAMSCHALMSCRQRVIEIPIPYGDRIGHSKLHPVRDGLRFLRVIVCTLLGKKSDPP